MQEAIDEQKRIDLIFLQLRSTCSMNEVYGMVKQMDEATAKSVLKKFIYAQ